MKRILVILLLAGIIYYYQLVLRVFVRLADFFEFVQVFHKQ